jgi:hypothetical protein
MTEKIISRDILQSKLDALKSTRERNQWKYYHIESVQNFIFHLNNIPSERTQNRMAGKIKAYLSLLEERTEKEHDIHELAKELLWGMDCFWNSCGNGNCYDCTHPDENKRKEILLK